MSIHAPEEVKKNVPLASHTSWLIGGPAEFFASPDSLEKTKAILIWAKAENIPVTILGGGTNILVPDEGLKGLVIAPKIAAIVKPEATLVRENGKIKFWMGASEPKSELLKLFLKFKLPPACFLAGLPGQVGGGVVMNAGVSEALVPREFCEITEAVEVLRLDGTVEIINSKDLQWSYRHCDGWGPGIILRVQFSWNDAPAEGVIQKVKELNQNRIQKQPLEWPSCGSVFRNPKPQSAGALIEVCGLKGQAIGGAEISKKHANFIINRGGATASDVKALIALCESEVKKRFGVQLQREVIYL